MKKINVINPTTEVDEWIKKIEDTSSGNVIRIFLAGTIDCGNSEDWQSKYIENLYNTHKDNDNIIIIYNPRRPSGKGLNPDDKKEMDYQVNWELDKLEKSDIIIMNILGNSKSPISLLELGLFAKSGKLEVICPEEFYRYDNVRIVCERNGIPLRHIL